MENTPDHDLLLELRGDVKTLTQDVREIKDNTKATLIDHETRLRAIEAEKFANPEPRIRFIEKYMWGAIAVVATIVLVIGWLVLLTPKFK